MAPNDPDDIAKYLDYLVSSLRDDKNDLKATSEEHRKTLTINNERAQKIVDAFNRGDISNKELTKRLIELVRETRNLTLGIQNTEKSNQIDRALRNRLIQVFEEVGRIDKKMFEKLATVFSNVESFSIFKTIKDSQSGNDSSPIFKNVIGNKKLKDISDDINKKLDLKIGSFQSKLFSFFEDKTKETDKKRKRMIDDLVEGLASSKFIGGALSDTFKLIGLMGASWLSHFGQLGRILGGAFYVAMTAFGPSITKMLVEGLGKLMWSGLKFLSGTIWKAITSQALRQGAGNLIYSMSKNGVSPALQAIAGTGAEKAAGIAKVGGLGLVGTAGLIGAKWAGGEAADSWRQGRKGNAVAMGAGAGLLGAGALAALGSIFVPALAPVVAPLLGIGAAVAVISKLWKDHSETIKKIAKPIGEFIKEALKFFWIMSPIGMLFRGLKAIVDKFVGLSKNKEIQSTQGENATVGKFNFIGGGTTSQLLTGKQIGNGNKHLDLNKFTQADWNRADTMDPVYGKMGEIVNLGQMSQKRASQVIAADIKSKRNKSFYEFVGTDLADTRSFETDARALDGSGVYLARGMSEKFKDMKTKLEAAGFDTSNVKITSGIGTLGKPGQVSPHAYSDSITGHFSSLATTIDTSKIYNKTTGRRLTQADLAKVGLGDYWLNSEGDHEHIAMKMLAWQKAAKKGKQQVEATKHSVEVEAALKKANEAAKTIDTYRDKDKKMSTQERENLIESVMKKQGFKYDNKQNTWIKASADDINKVAIIPPTGNDDFLSVQQNLSTVVMYGGNQERIS